MALYSSLVNLMEVEGEQERATSAVLTSPLSAESLSSSRSQPQCQPQLHGYRFVLMQVNEEIGTEQDSKMISSVSWLLGETERGRERWRCFHLHFLELVKLAVDEDYRSY
nr:uncharacterized protein LOC125423057 [Ziziphus jujuba var. spinosa]XP_048332352.1 uncharacterized protein LOC125423085 [Ziziphus jujuba var. spinosa]